MALTRCSLSSSKALNPSFWITSQPVIAMRRKVAKLMLDAGIVVITAFISPFRAERDLVRRLFDPNDFDEVFVSASLEAAEARDPKGLYKKARAGELPNFTGIDSDYEAPGAPELILDTENQSVTENATRLVDMIQQRIDSI